MKKVKKFFLSFLACVLATVSITTLVGAIFFLSKEKEIEIKKNAFDWTKIPNELHDFSIKNSYRVSLSIGGSYVSQGTAWSWYYKKINETSSFGTVYENYDWYLMTNFHVVNEAIAFTLNLTEEIGKEVIIKDEQKLLNYYHNNVETNYKNYAFSISKFDSLYTNIITNRTSYLTNVSIITDFDNDNVKLFSSGTNTNLHYNLDMALIKLSLKIPKNTDFALFSAPNVWETYKSYTPEEAKAVTISNNVETYISGHPAAKSQLVGILFDKDQKWVREPNIDFGNDLGILKNFKAPYYYSKNFFDSFELSAGASGSAVYQFKDINNLNLERTIPIGIYWGGSSTTQGTQEIFKPSIIPFIDSTFNYNVFDNFASYLNI